ncbi:Serine protease family S01A [Phytophthora cinnamomi]|uniref:Serine protease family S01A n=1 Tax=Phytophthora cinnamomi TaxID=4785 RepID=UPI003559FC15|nr:Serine protease family S01A [Phytophthora cinnamomi]
MDYIKDILAGGDGSKFNVTSSSSGSMEVSLPLSAEGSSSDATTKEASESGSAEDTKTPATKATKKPATKATKTPVVEDGSESGSDGSDEEAASGSGEIPAWLLKYFEGSGSAVDLSWLFGSGSDLGSASDIGSESSSASEDSGSEDPVLVKGKTTKATKATTATKAPVVEDSEDSPYQQTSVEDESASTLGSESESAPDDVAHQSEQSEPTTSKLK